MASNRFQLFNLKLISSPNGLLLLATVIAFAWANSPWAGAYLSMLETHLRLGPVGGTLDLSLLHWVNDGLMVVFFLLVGLDLKEELLIGELSQPREAILAIFAALGGMVVPAGLYLLLNAGAPGEHGWGVPMATDIAFSLACLGALGSRVPASLKVFLMALAIVDDLGAIVVIALFYSTGVAWLPLLGAGAIVAALLVLNRLGVKHLAPYLLLGVGLWYLFLISGVHATIAGVLLAFTIPLDRSDHSKSPLHRLARGIQPLVSRFILPVFALFNAGLSVAGAAFGSITGGVLLGLVVGKPIGILLFSWLAVAVGVARLPGGVTWSGVLGAGSIAGIGFTMSLFIAGLAFDNAAFFDEARLGVLAGSLVSAVIGSLLLLSVGRKDRGTRTAVP